MLTEMNYARTVNQISYITEIYRRIATKKSYSSVFANFQRETGMDFKYSWLNIIHRQTTYLHSRGVFTTEYKKQTKTNNPLKNQPKQSVKGF